MKRHLHLILSGVALLSLVAACGGDGDPLAVPDEPGTDATVDTTTESPELPDAGTVGSCTVTVTGDVTAEWVAAGGASAVGYGPWYGGPEITTALGTTDASFFILNCDSGDGNFIGFVGQNDIPIPMAPATYDIAPGDNLYGSSTSGPIGVLISLESTETNWTLRGAGQLVITEFDAEHIAGTFTLPITDAFAEMNGTSQGDAVLNGAFDFGNPN